MPTPEQLLDFWFADSLASTADLADHVARWFRGGPAFDHAIAARFGAAIERAGRGELDSWAMTPQGRLALILLLDQFTRNTGRGSARAYRFDARAVRLCREGLKNGDDRVLVPLAREFFYMPLLHSERLADQRLGIACFERLRAEAPAALAAHFGQSVAIARRYCAIIGTFGRFPHRNAVLGRQSAFSERLFLGYVVLRRGAARALARLAAGRRH